LANPLYNWCAWRDLNPQSFRHWLGTHFTNINECEQGDLGCSARRDAQLRRPPLQAAQRCNAPKSSVPEGFVS